MHDLVIIVIPRIKAEWEDVAYALHLKIPKVDAIRKQYHGDPKKCC